VLPDRVEGAGLLLRRWRVADAEAQQRAVTESIEHLRPWMAWIADEPQSLDRRRVRLAEWERSWARGGDVFLAILADNRVLGSAGLHRRRGPGRLEIGYWIHAGFLRRGLATSVGHLLTDAAFSVAGIERVEIHHDKANVASAGVPRRLGFTPAAETFDGRAAPAEAGIDCAWHMTRRDWVAIHVRGGSSARYPADDDAAAAAG
jgi:RimJ/RimL family protein N-acetyltransferase